MGNMDLKTYLDLRNESLQEFIDRSGLSWMTVKKVLDGKKIRIDTAQKIVKYTKKEVTLEDLEDLIDYSRRTPTESYY
jgi:predicted transcriptional regulator